MTTITHQTALPSIELGGRISLGKRMARLLQTLVLWRERAHERRALAAMDTRQLKDIGLSNVDAWREANKPLWRD